MIKIYDKYYIDSDKYSYQVMKEQGTDKNGNTIYKAISYHNNFYECIDKILTLKQREVVANCSDLKTVLFEFRMLNDEMQSVLNQIKNIESGGMKK